MTVATVRSADLTARRVKPLLDLNLNADQIAERLGLSKRTVQRAVALIKSDAAEYRVKDLLEIVAGMKWMLDAPCVGMDVDIFVPDEAPYLSYKIRPPKPCRTCPVKKLCLKRGQTTGSEGWWGGKYLYPSPAEMIGGIDEPDPEQSELECPT